MLLIYIPLLIAAFILYVKWRQTYWQRKNVPTSKFDFFIGHFKPILTGQLSFSQFTLKNYKDAQKESPKHVGFYFFTSPIYMPLDAELIKQILVKDFDHFTDHGLYHHPKDTLSMHLFNLEGDRWKNLRNKLSPTFTSGKIKMMFNTLLDKSQELDKLVTGYSRRNEPFAVKDMSSRYTTDVIASSIFGIECNSLQNPNEYFWQYGKKVLDPHPERFWIQGIIPWKLIGYLGYKDHGRESLNFFTKVVKETIEAREKNGIYRKDLMHLLLQLRNRGRTDDDSLSVDGKTQLTLSEADIAAQCFIFFVGGFETSSTTMSFAILELAAHPEVQETLREEIIRVLEKHDGNITYDAIKEMQYLEKVIFETLRRNTPLASLNRICTKDYRVPGTDVVIEKGTRVDIPAWGIHMDPQYYPEPEKFDPEHFSEESKAARPPYTFLPFGEGPRICVGLRFGLMQTKVGLATLLRRFKFTLGKDTTWPLKPDMNAVLTSVAGDVYVNAIPL